MQDSPDLVALRRAVRQDFSLEIAELQPIKVQPNGNHVFSGRASGREVIVRVSTGPNTCAVEAWAYQRYGQLGIPVPRVVAYRADPPTLGHPTMILTKLPGQPLATIGGSADDAGRVCLELGQMVRKMHDLTVPGFGFLRVEAGMAVGQYASWQAFLRERPLADLTHYLCRHDLIDETEEELLIDNLNRLDDVRLTQAVFVHGDLNRHNVLVEAGRVAGILDPANGLAGDPRLDVAVVHLWQTGRQRRAFAEGYGGPATDPWVARYHVWVAAQRLAWRHATGRHDGPARRTLVRALRDAWSILEGPSR